ncbi:Type 1 phosphatases regulator YPI1 [Ceratobasidium sp. AG-Ba]|nr:Type 1 phosphatases regulator YPI1 [Ceratobasidium sp. AG-Ba]
MTSTARRPNTSAPSDGSRTITVRDSQPVPEDSSDSHSENTGILRLRGGPRSRPRVMWDADVIDNEGCGKKKSKICCIYHKPKRFDESSDESSDDSDASCGSNDSRTRPRHNHNHSPDQRSQPTNLASGSGSSTTIFQPEPNAYEKPSSNPKGKRKGTILAQHPPRARYL